MGTGIPLLNEYKQDFFFKRFPQTVFGGPKLKIGYDAPPYVYLNQLVLFFFPFLLGGIFTLLVELETMDDYVGGIVFGCLMCAFVIITHIITTVVQAKMASDTNYPTKRNLLAEEDEVDFFSCCGVETFEFVVPMKKFRLNIAIHAIAGGALCGLSLMYLSPMTLNNLYNNNTGATVMLFIFGWFTLCVAQYPLTVAAPPEIATYRTTDRWELSPLTRPFYLGVCIAFHLLWKYQDATTFRSTDQTLHIVYACMIVLWTCGLLPPLDCLFFWLFEQVHVYLLGGSPMASELRLVVLLTISLAVYFGTYFMSTSLGAVILCAVTGYLFSTDLGGLGTQIYQFIKYRNRVSNDQGTVAIRENSSKFQFLWKWGVFEFLYHFVMLAIVGVMAGLLNFNSADFGQDVWKILGYVIIGICVIEKVVRDIQSVYIVFGLWRNMLFPGGSSSRMFKPRKRLLLPLGIARRVLVNWVAPLVMLAYSSVLITTSDPDSLSLTVNRGTYESVWYIFGVVRVFRAIWQSTTNTLLDFSIAHIILVTMDTNTDVTKYGLPVLSLLISLCRDRCFQFLNKMYFFFALLITSWTDKKQRRSSSACIFAMIIFLFPLYLGIVALATAISAPLLPFFTLPIFFVAFPRPNKFWPEDVGASANVNPDTMFYKQFAPVFSAALRRGFANGSLGEPNPGNHYLARFQDRLVWLMILERGAGYCTVNIKGLELQETSCHTVEAARLDDIMEEAFELKESVKVGKLNHYPLHSLTPVDSDFVPTYSDARNVLTGIIDSPDAFRITMNSFVKSLVWVLLHHVNKMKLKEKSREKNSLITENNSISSQGKEKVEMEEIQQRQETNNNISNRNTQRSSIRAVTPTQAQNNMFVTVETNKSQPSVMTKSKKMKSSWGSLASFTDSIFSEDEFTDNKNKKKAPIRQEVSPIFGAPAVQATKTVMKDPDDIDDLINDLDFGLPAMDINKPKTVAQPASMTRAPQKRNTFGNSIYKPVTNLAGSPDFKCPYSAQISLPKRWRELPLEYSQLSKFLGQFPKDWYKHVLETLDWSGTNQSKGSVVPGVANDDTLMNCYTQLAMACYSIFDSSASYNSASTMYKFYIGDLPWNAMVDWLAEDKELYSLVLKAYRYGFKMMLDQVLLGEFSSPEEVQECLEEYDRDWYIGMEKDEEWKAAVLSSRPNLFSLGHNNTQGTYSSRQLSIQEVLVQIGRLNAEAVKAQWANLSLELLYFTNDDEERYSIQAHPAVLRNLTVQAADPPLGYPIFSSQPISIPTI